MESKDYGQGMVEKLEKMSEPLVEKDYGIRKACGGLVGSSLAKEEAPPRKPTDEERVAFLLLTRRLIEESIVDTPHGVIIGLHCAIPDYRVRKQLADELIAKFK